MKKAVIKTTQNEASVLDFLNQLDNEQKKQDSLVILEIMKKVTGEEPKMWGAALIGFGFLTITSPSGRVVDWFRLGFSPRKANLSLYLSGKLLVDPAYMENLGKYKTGQGCLYINKLEDVDMTKLEKLIADSIRPL